MARSRILIVDDDVQFARLLEKRLKDNGFETAVAGTAEEATRILQADTPDLVLLDLMLPDKLGTEIIPTIKSKDVELPVIVVSGKGETKDVVGAMKAGASDYIHKPIDDALLLEKVTSLLEMRKTMLVEKELIDEIGDNILVGRSRQMKQLIREIGKIAQSDAPVLIQGESGTGKGMVAELVHSHSNRKDALFVTINCAAIPENLLESELFGHVKGAFTGAVRDKVGKFQYADKGTIFLDEIGDLSPELQVKILRVLQGHEFERVGGLETIRVDIRIIAATNRNLDEAILNRRFREDLFYRLNVLPISMPPLRERRDDIPLLTEHFFRYYCRKANKHFDGVPDDVMQKLVDYEWPGNIRELQNVIERAVVMGREPHLRLPDFIIKSASPPPPSAPIKSGGITSIDDLEYSALIESLKKTNSNISGAAKLMGVSRNKVYRLLRKHDIGLKKGKGSGSKS